MSDPTLDVDNPDPIGDLDLDPQLDAILDRFRFHPATPITGPQHAATRDIFGRVAAFLAETIPAGRHQSLALTALQESMMWANAAIACDTPKENDV